MVDIEKIHKKTNGHCHFCGDRVELTAYGNKHNLITGKWALDHVIYKSAGGKNKSENYLPICQSCNRARWNRKGKNLRELITIGFVFKTVLAKKAGKHKVVHEIFAKYKKNLEKRRHRRQVK